MELRWSEINCSVEYLLDMRPESKNKLISLSAAKPPDGFYRYWLEGRSANDALGYRRFVTRVGKEVGKGEVSGG